MKKAKIMLSAIAVLAIVGGTVAFKSHSRNVVLFTGTAKNVCSVGVFAIPSPDGHATVFTGAVAGDCATTAFTTTSPN